MIYVSRYQWGDATLDVVYNRPGKRDALIRRMESSTGVKVTPRPLWTRRIVKFDNPVTQGWSKNVKTKGAILALGLSAI